MLNSVQLIGNLTKDPEIRTMGNGKQVANLRIATNESFKDKNGDWQDKSEYHSVVIFNEFLVRKAERLSKGSKVYFEGQIQTRSYDKDGEKKYITEIVAQNFRGALIPLEKTGQGMGGADNQFGGDELDDHIPF